MPPLGIEKESLNSIEKPLIGAEKICLMRNENKHSNTQSYAILGTSQGLMPGIYAMVSLDSFHTFVAILGFLADLTSCSALGLLFLMLGEIRVARGLNSCSII
ncbi:hypothetical protein HQ45_00040 [Porphyromonas crevioricanis]|nr:hypothetical protein HQ45_00040 [Porphyromonas crevioricanis]